MSFQINAKIMKYAKKDSIFLHWLPRGPEVSNEVFLGRDYGRQQDYSDEVASSIDQEVKLLLNDAHVIAKKILTKYKKQMKSMVNSLIENETLDKDSVQQLFRSVPKVKLLGTGSSIKLVPMAK